jgi:hypothetical protein
VDAGDQVDRSTHQVAKQHTDGVVSFGPGNVRDPAVLNRTDTTKDALDGIFELVACVRAHDAKNRDLDDASFYRGDRSD